MDVDVNIADLPEVNAPKVQVLRELQLVTVTPAIAAERGLRRQSGALIYNISADGVGSDRSSEGRRDHPDQPHLASRRAQDVARVIDAIGGRALSAAWSSNDRGSI